MDSGYKWIYSSEDYSIEDAGDYFAVYDWKRKENLHIASFKTEELAIEYITYKRRQLQAEKILSDIYGKN